MEQKRDLAIVLRSVPYEERHRVVTALTEQHGKISALARNSIQSRRFGGALEPFTAAEWFFVERHGADLYRVEQAIVRRDFDGLRKDFQKLALASVFNEVMMKLAPEREPCPELFRLHSNALAAVEELSETLVPSHAIILLNGYLAKLMQWGGSQAQLGQCMECRLPLEALADRAGSVNCIVADAGWICPDCRMQQTRHVRERSGLSFTQAMIRVSPAALKDFQLSLGAPIRQLPALMTASHAEHRALYTFIEALLEYHSPGFSKDSLKSLRFLDLDPAPAHAL